MFGMTFRFTLVDVQAQEGLLNPSSIVLTTAVVSVGFCFIVLGLLTTKLGAKKQQLEEIVKRRTSYLFFIIFLKQAYCGNSFGWRSTS
jgi:hypothetical protein